MESELIVEISDSVAHVWLNRPQRRHALSLSLLSQLDETLQQLAEDNTVRVVVIGSSGKVFSSGHDLSEMQDRSEDEYRELFAQCSRTMLRIRQMPQPVIARVQGFATAAGCQLVAACDLAVAVDTAQFATPGVKIGLFCTTPMVPLVRSVPPKVAMEMLLTGQPISAERALAVGLINRVVSEEELDATIKELADAIVSSSPMTIAIGKREFYSQLCMDESTAYQQAVCVMTDNVLKHDAQEGMTAFLEKRKPEWKGE